MSRELNRQFESAVVVKRRQFAAPDGGSGGNLGLKVFPGSTPAVHRKPVLQEGGTVRSCGGSQETSSLEFI